MFDVHVAIRDLPCEQLLWNSWDIVVKCWFVKYMHSIGLSQYIIHALICNGSLLSAQTVLSTDGNVFQMYCQHRWFVFLSLFNITEWVLSVYGETCTNLFIDTRIWELSVWDFHCRMPYNHHESFKRCGLCKPPSVEINVRSWGWRSGKVHVRISDRLSLFHLAATDIQFYMIWVWTNFVFLE